MGLMDKLDGEVNSEPALLLESWALLTFSAVVSTSLSRTSLALVRRTTDMSDHDVCYMPSQNLGSILYPFHDKPLKNSPDRMSALK